MENIIITKTKRKTICIKITDDARVVVKAPKQMTQTQILDFIEKHKNWIDKKLFEKNSMLKQNQDIISYEYILFLGKKYKTIFLNCDEIMLKENSIYIPLKFKKNLKLNLKKWYVQNFDKIILPRVYKLLDVLKKDVTEIKVINSKCKWGMCDSNKKLYFNYKILMLPQHLFDYIIVHEICHLFEMNHSKKFYNLVNQILPNYKNLMLLLKDCSFLLKNL